MIELPKDWFSKAYRTGFAATVRFLMSRGARHDEAEEIAQSAWTRGWEARVQVSSPSSVVPWVNTIALRAMCKERRRGQRVEPCPADPPSPAAARMLGRVSERLDAIALISRCTPVDRSLLFDRYFKEAPFDDLARRYGLSPLAARIRVHRAMHSLREFVRGRVIRERMAA